MTDFLREHWPAAALLLGMGLFLLCVAAPIHRKHVRRRISQDDFPDGALDTAFERSRREREEADPDVA